MLFRIEGHRFRGLGLATLVASAAFLFSPVQSLAIEPPFGQARAMVQEMLGEAIAEDSLARTSEEKGRAQEKIGFAIFNLALIDLEEPKQLYLPKSRESYRPNSGEMQEMLGAAIIEAAWAKTHDEKTLRQEVLGLIIVNDSLRKLSESLIGTGGAVGSIVKRP